MRIETARVIAEAANDIGVDVAIREGYSGRGMYGKTTTGIVGSRTAIVRATALAAVDVSEVAGSDAVDDFLADLDWSWDQMGRDEIAY